MKKILIQILKFLGGKFHDYYWITNVLELHGHTESRQLGLPVNNKGEPIPWFTYPAIEFLQALDLTSKDIFEWGSGNSSKYFRSRCKGLVSIENNEEYFNVVSKNKPKNHDILFCQNADYTSSILNFDQKFDIIIIDGDDRKDCAENALEKINVDGMIILDNSDRDPEICQILREKGDLIQVDMHGFGPINRFPWTTSIFFTRQCRFDPINQQPTLPIGGIPN